MAHGEPVEKEQTDKTKPTDKQTINIINWIQLKSIFYEEDQIDIIIDFIWVAM